MSDSSRSRKTEVVVETREKIQVRKVHVFKDPTP